MNITINSFGTRGDIQPYVALGKGLIESGHTVRILTHHIFEEFVIDNGLGFHPIPLDPRQVLINQAVAELGNNFLRIMTFLKEGYREAMQMLFRVTDEAADGADLLINSSLSFAGYHVGEKLGIPTLAAYLQPVTPTKHFHSMSSKPPPGWLPFKAGYNYLSTKLTNQLFFMSLLSLTNSCRKDILGLPQLKASYYWGIDIDPGVPILYGYSSLVLPKPPDWGDHLQVSGYWILDEPGDYVPEARLLQFLEEDPPPIYIGFGSMVDHEREEMVRLIIDALDLAECRGIVLGGWSDLSGEQLPESILAIEYAPHEWLFPRMAAVVHHGGAGTTASGLRAGVPSIIVPFFADQFFWGWRVEQLGTGPTPIPRNRLTAEALAGAIRQAIEDPEIRSRSSKLGYALRREDGVAQGVKSLEYLCRKISIDPAG